jgi:hypothetical protein
MDIMLQIKMGSSVNHMLFGTAGFSSKMHRNLLQNQLSFFYHFLQGIGAFELYMATISHLFKQSCMLMMILLSQIAEKDILQIFRDCALVLVEHV